VNPRARTDTGFTLVELLVTMVLISVVSMLVVAAMSQASRTFLHADDENEGLADAKNVMDRVARDIRESRGVVCDGAAQDPNCAYHLQLWIDGDSDYAEDPDEVVTWRLQPSPDGEHFDVWRETSAGNSRVASSLIVQTLFEYDTPAPTDATLVNITMRYDAKVGVGVDMRTASTSARLRNK
jgi:prepilin-type N-terminal cleavage/methylation domain-containing protein